MALPKQKKSGLRLLKHLDTSYYWKVRSHDGTMLHVIVGYENRPSCFFNIELSFVDPSLYFPWMAAAQEQGRDVASINELQAVSPKFIVSAIAIARTSGWPEKSPLKLCYKHGKFVIEE